MLLICNHVFTNLTMCTNFQFIHFGKEDFWRVLPFYWRKNSKLFAHSNSFVFWEEISRNENKNTAEWSFQTCRKFTYTQKPNLFTVLIGQNLPTSLKCLENVAFLFQRVPTLKVPTLNTENSVLVQKIKLMIKNIAFPLKGRHYNLVSQCAESNYVKYSFDDVIHHFTLSADDFGPQQNPKSQRTSHMGMAAILVTWPGSFEQTLRWGSTWNLASTGPVVSENVWKWWTTYEWQRMAGQQSLPILQAHPCTSGELKIYSTWFLNIKLIYQ